MDISPITNDSKSGYSNEPTPKDRNTEIITSKKRKTGDSVFMMDIHSQFRLVVMFLGNTGGLVSYPMDEDENENFEEDEDEADSEPYLNFVHDKESSNEKDSKSYFSLKPSLTNDEDGPDSQNLISVDNDECFNAEGRESDMENDDSNRPAGDIDLKSRSGQSSSTVKAIVLTKRPKGSELAYLLSRQILNNRAEIHLPALPTAKPPQEHEQRILELRAKAKSSPWGMTQSILNNKEYRNPRFAASLVVGFVHDVR